MSPETSAGLLYQALQISHRTPQAMLRLQGLILIAIDSLARTHPPDELDGVFWEALRESLIAAGADEGDLRFMAIIAVLLMVRNTPAESDEREKQLRLIAENLACSEMEVRTRANAVVSVIFSEQRIH